MTTTSSVNGGNHRISDCGNHIATDLRLFQRRLTEILDNSRRHSTKCLIFLLTIFLVFIYRLFGQLTSRERKIKDDPIFIIVSVTLIMSIVFFKIHYHIISHHIFIKRCQNVFLDFRLNMDKNGKIIIRK
ncbi:hypothetical protein SNEBB_011098 [Seison nebaliae]|nr:hypothetical protein SNEBB_011098 [Seison nebaliae]